MSTLGLERHPGRCAHGFHIATQRGFCDCTESDEWSTFLAAIEQAAAQSPDGLVHQTAVRPLIAAIPPKHRGLLYRRARNDGLLVEAGWEQSTDIAGRNGDKQQRYYELRSAAA